MSKTRKFFIGLVAGIVYLLSALPVLFAQSSMYSDHGWQMLDYRMDSVFGAGVNRSYETLLKGKTAVPVIVAVIDMGVDTAHEDLVGHIWTNTKEIPGNGIDDDGNGYVDDIHGWNFLGGKNDKNINIESYESYREYYRLFKDSSGGATGFGYSDSLYRYTVKKSFLKDSLQQQQAVYMLAQVIPQMHQADSILKFSLHKDSIYVHDIVDYQPSDSTLIQVKKNTLTYFRKYGITPDMSLGQFIAEAEEYFESSRIKLKQLSTDPNLQRKEIVGDNPDDINDRNYGNNNVAAGNTEHGTHVAGIIAASRQNGKGMDGIDDHVYIMVLRAVPDGDERDKDVALAIRYAVDNGARIINLSFGKNFSPGKKWVDEAVRYAGEHDVLIVHAAGNENKNIDSIPHFPNPEYEAFAGRSELFLTVAASSGGPDSLIFARFSNYGKKEVDLFAPGVKIYSALPSNRYAAWSGTSMATPVVTGVAALIMEYYPQLSARQIRYILMHSVMHLPDNQVKWPGSGKMVDFSQYSVSGGIVNAFNALQMASRMKGERRSGNSR